LNDPSQSSMNPTLRERLVRAEQHFLLAVVSNDEESLKVFSQEWSQLARDIENTKAVGRLDDNMAHLLSEVSQAIENMMVCMLESGTILQEFMTCSISDFIQDIPPDDPSLAPPHTQVIAPYHLLFSDLSSPMKSTVLGQQKLLDSYAYCWIMQNIHDPYPNSTQMQIISDLSGTSTAQVEHWFQEARDSIGWNKLSRDFFAGSVNATVAAARGVYLEHDKNISFDVVFAFTTVKAFAETLFLENPLLQEKDVDMGSARAIRTMAMDQDHHMRSFTGEPILDSEDILVPPQVDCLAPPDPLSDMSDSDESEEEDTTPPPPIAGCKRPLAEDVHTSQAASLGRPQKRHRCVVILALAPLSD
jgi:Homeobox KN domain